MSYHAVVWLDHREAKIFQFEEGEALHTEKIKSDPHKHIHHRGPVGHKSGHRPPEDQHYYKEIAQALHRAGEILIVGPSTAKLEILRYLHTHDRSLESKVVGVETIDHPSDGQLVAYARKYFKIEDRMR